MLLRGEETKIEFDNGSGAVIHFSFWQGVRAEPPPVQAAQSCLPMTLITIKTYHPRSSQQKQTKETLNESLKLKDLIKWLKVATIYSQNLR